MSAPANGSTLGEDASLAHYGVKLLLTNQFSAAKKLYEDKFNEDPKIALLHSFLSYGTAISSYSEADLKAAIDSCKRAEAIGEKLEKVGKKEESGKRIEGMLIQADCDLLTACVNLVQEEYVKMMWNMRKSYNMYQDVNKMVDKYGGKDKPSWRAGSSTAPDCSTSSSRSCRPRSCRSQTQLGTRGTGRRG